MPWRVTTSSRKPRRLAACSIRHAEGRARTPVRAARRAEDCPPYRSRVRFDARGASQLALSEVEWVRAVLLRPNSACRGCPPYLCAYLVGGVIRVLQETWKNIER